MKTRFIILAIIASIALDVKAIDPIGTYRIKNIETGLYLVTKPNGNLKVEISTASTDFEWRFSELSPGIYNIDNLTKDRGVLDNDAGNSVKWVTEEPNSADSDKEWQIIDLGNGQIRIDAKKSDRGFLTSDSLGNVSWTFGLGDDTKWELEDVGKGILFEPWDQAANPELYNAQGELISTIKLDTSVWFGYGKSKWAPVLSEDFKGSSLFSLSKPGIYVDGNNVSVDGTDSILSVASISELWQKSFDNESLFSGNLIGKRFMEYTLGHNSLIADSTVITDFAVSGFSQGFRTSGNNHPVLIKNCSFKRCGGAIYLKGRRATFFKCFIEENNGAGVYSGSKSESNIFDNCTFGDNLISQNNISYGDFVGDTYWNTKLVNNTFYGTNDTTTSGPSKRLIGVSVYRNAGEPDGSGNPNIREQMPHKNAIKNNTFTGYTVGIHQGSRMGRNSGQNDASGEGRDYAFYDTLEGNHFVDTNIGIKINTEANVVRGNTFSNVNYPIVLQCVFFKLNVSVYDQQNTDVYTWYTDNDYPPNTADIDYDDLFDFQASKKDKGSDKDASDGINKNEKRITVFTDINAVDQPNFKSILPDSVLEINPVTSLAFLEDFRVGSPIDTAMINLTDELPGLEIAAIYDKKISKVKAQSRYSILFFDENGTEINRSGLSKVKWGQLTAGEFDFPIQGNPVQSIKREVAAVPAALGKTIGSSNLSEEISVGYPVFIFQRGFEDPMYVRYPYNANRNVVIGTDKTDESLIVVGDIDTLSNYRIRSAAVDNNYLKAIAGGKLEIAGFSGSTNRMWQFFLTEDGFFNLDNKSPNKETIKYDADSELIKWTGDVAKEFGDEYEWEVFGNIAGFVTIKNRVTEEYLAANSSKQVYFTNDSSANEAHWFLEKIETPSAVLQEGKNYRLFNEYSSTYLTANDKENATKQSVSKEFELRTVTNVEDDFNTWTFVETNTAATFGTTAYNIDNLSEEKGMMVRDFANNIKWNSGSLSPVQTADTLVWEVWTLADGQIRIKRSDTTGFIGPNEFQEAAYYQDTTNLTKWKLIEVESSSTNARLAEELTDHSAFDEEDEWNATVPLYPVPSRNGVFTLSAGNIDDEFIIFNSQGKIIYKSIIKSSDGRIDLSSLKNGYYLIKLKNSTRKLIIAK
ncbi:MAG: T9SS type A sorting domain-containing protein [Bacteroidota bacterium]